MFITSLIYKIIKIFFILGLLAGLLTGWLAGLAWRGVWGRGPMGGLCLRFHGCVQLCA